MDVVNSFLDKMTQWIDTAFGWFGFYSNGYSKYIMWAILLMAASKVFKFNFKMGGHH